MDQNVVFLQNFFCFFVSTGKISFYLFIYKLCGLFTIRIDKRLVFSFFEIVYRSKILVHTVFENHILDNISRSLKIIRCTSSDLIFSKEELLRSSSSEQSYHFIKEFCLGIEVFVLFWSRPGHS